MDFHFLFVIAIILLSTKAFGLLSGKVHMPQVIGALIAGIVLGPSVLDLVGESDFITKSAEIGVILLMFLAGLDTNLEELKKNGLKSFLVAIVGIILPVTIGSIAYYFFYKEQAADPLFILKSVFVGVVITSTSVSITIEALREMGKLKGKVGTTILGAAIIDDIIGIIGLSLITSMADSEVSISNVIIKIILFFVFIIIIGVIIKYSKKFIDEHKGKRRSSIYAIAFCFLVSYCSEHFFGIADITGAYFAGMLLCNLGIKGYVGKKVNILSYSIFSPIFFASVGLKTSFDSFTPELVVFTVLFVLIAIITKIIGCGLGSRFAGIDKVTSLCIGAGMIARGEVTLIGAQKGFEVGLLDHALFPAIVLVVVITDLITPVLLKITLAYREKKLGDKAD